MIGLRMIGRCIKIMSAAIAMPKRSISKADKPYQVGEVFSHAPLAKAIKLIQQKGRDTFYQGEITEDMLTKLHAIGGTHSESDFAKVEAEFITPISA